MSATIALDGAPVLNPREFEQISKLAYDHFGLDLRNGKQGLIAARLGKKLRELGLKSFQHYYDYVQADTTGAALATMVDFLTTNHTSFFREPRHFDFLRETIFPTLRGRAHIHIWSAACSSGEEPYSVAMMLAAELPQVNWQILGTDISTRVLESARVGLYEMARTQGIPVDYLRRFCLKGTGPHAGTLLVDPALKKRVEFRHLNLNEPLPDVGAFDVILLRNVMIYFDAETKARIIERLTERLLPGGHLLIGHCDTLNGVPHTLTMLKTSIYRKSAS